MLGTIFYIIRNTVRLSDTSRSRWSTSLLMKLNRDNSKSLDAARASSSLSNSQCSKEPRAARAKCRHILISLSQFIEPEASVIEPKPELKCKRQTKDVNIRDFLFFFWLPSVQSQRMFYQFAHNKCLDYSQAEQSFKSSSKPEFFLLLFDYLQGKECFISFLKGNYQF